MNKAELVEWIAENGGVADSKAAAERALIAVLEGIEKGLKKDGQVQLIGFGSLSEARILCHELSVVLRMKPFRTCCCFRHMVTASF